MTDQAYQQAADLLDGEEMVMPRRRDAVTLLSVYMLLLMAIPAPLVFAPLGDSGGPATIFAALLFVWCVVLWLHPAFETSRDRQPIRVVGVVFGWVTLAAYVSANMHAQPQLEQNGADRGIISLAGWLGVLLLATDGIGSIERLRTFLRRIVIGATAMATLGMTQFLTGLDATKYIVIPGLTRQTLFTDLLARGSLNRPSATATHPLEFAAVLAMCLPLAIHQARYAPPRLRARRWLQVGVIGLTLPMTVSRSAFLAIAALCIVLLPTWPKRERRLAYCVIAVSFAVMFVLIPGLLGTVRNLFFQAGSDSSTLSRTGAFSSAAPFIAQHPWFGRGFGTFLPQTYFFLDDQYLGSTIETGIIGLMALVALFVTGWIVARRTRRLAVSDRERGDLAQSLAASIAAAVVCFATFDALGFAIASGLTFTLIGCVGALFRFTKMEHKAARGSDISA